MSPALWGIQPAPQPELLGWAWAWAWWLRGEGAEVPERFLGRTLPRAKLPSPLRTPPALGSALP